MKIYIKIFIKQRQYIKTQEISNLCHHVAVYIQSVICNLYFKVAQKHLNLCIERSVFEVSKPQCRDIKWSRDLTQTRPGFWARDIPVGAD